MRWLVFVFPEHRLETEAHQKPYQATSPSELYDEKKYFGSYLRSFPVERFYLGFCEKAAVFSS